MLGIAATSLPLSAMKTANWWSIAPPWLANSWKSSPDEQ